MNSKATTINHTVKEPLQGLYEKYNFYGDEIKDIIYGDIYIAVVLKNGNIGLSANLNNLKGSSISDHFTPNIKNPDHRLILNAYYNAKLNYESACLAKRDLFEAITFKLYRNIVMIGYSKPMYKKLDSLNKRIYIFDHSKDESFLVDQSLQKDHLSRTECVILTATTIVNNTFTEIVNNTGSNCDIYLVGPSTPVTYDMFKYKNLKALFGTVFKKNDTDVIEIIKKGEGTRVFKHLGKKIALIKN